MNEVQEMIERLADLIADIGRRLDLIEKYTRELEQTKFAKPLAGLECSPDCTNFQG